MKRIFVPLLVLATFLGLVIAQPHSQASTATPTVFVHGLQGSHKSTDWMINDLAKRKGAKKVMTINVQSDGTLQVSGKLSSKVKRPLVQVNFENNVASSIQNAEWLATALRYLKRHGASRINIVAHSAGNVATYLALTQQKKLPTVVHYVCLAGPFDGVIGMNDTANANSLLKSGAPKTKYAANDYYPAYTTLEKLATNFPKSIKVLNIYGNLEDGSNSDGLVSNVSARSLDYLLRHQRHAVKDKMLTGAKATHSGLHKSSKVDNWIAAFLWN